MRTHLALVLPALVWCAPQIFFGRVGYLRDTGLYFLPHRALIAEALRHGRLPEWNPFEYGGLPLLADPNFNTFHPLSLLTDLLPLPWGYGLFVFACALSAAYGARALGRTLGLGHSGALACGLFFAWSGPTVSFLLTGQAVASCSLPWLCAAGARLGREGTLRSALWFALASALQLLSGTPEVGACGFAIAALLALSESAAGTTFATAAKVTLSAALGAGLSAIQILPTAAYLAASSRGNGIDPAEALAYSLHPLRLPGLLLPFFAGDSDGPGAPSWLFPPTQPFYVLEIYLGVGVALLALLGLRSGGPRRHWPLLVVALAGVVLSFGSHLPLAEFLWHSTPLLRSVRYPEKLIVPLSLAAAVSAGAGWARLGAILARIELSAGDAAGRLIVRSAFAIAALLLVASIAAGAPWAWLSAPSNSWPIERLTSLASSALSSLSMLLLLGACAALSLALLSLGRIRRSFATAVLAALLVAELGGPALRLNRTAAPEDWADPPALAAILRADAHGDVHISAQSSGLSTSQLDGIAEADGSSRSLALFRLRRAALIDAGAARFGLRSDRGTSGFSPGKLQRLYRSAGSGAVLDLLGVRYAIAVGQQESPYAVLGFAPRDDLSAQANAQLPTLAGGHLRVYENLRAVSTGWLAPGVLVGAGEGLAPRCGAQLVPWLDEADLPLLPQSIPRAASCAALAALGVASPASASAGQVQLDSFANEAISFRVDANAASLLVLTETALPGWRAFVDGAEVPVLSADGALRACAVPAGHHAAEFRYAAPGLRSGAWVTALSLALVALLALRRPAMVVSLAC